MSDKQSAPRFAEGLVDQFISRRVCARCFGELTKRDTDSRIIYEVYCPNCEDAWNFTTVSRYYATQLGQKAIMEYWEARNNLQDLFPSPHKGKSPEQLIKELGF